MDFYCKLLNDQFTQTKEGNEMSGTEEANQRLSDVRKKLGLGLIISWIVPLVMVMLLRRLLGNDAIALAVAGAFPAVWTIVLLVRRGRVDWIGVTGVLGFAGAFAASAFLGGGSLPYKVYRPVGTGVIGLVFLISGVIRRPLVLSLARSFASKNPEISSRLERAWSTPAGRRKFSFITAVMGFVFLVDSVVHIIMALTLPTVTYLVMSRVVTVAGLVILLGARRIGGPLIQTKGKS